MNENEGRQASARLTVTLAPGQREVLAAIAKRNHTTLAFVVRQAIGRFVEEHKDREIKLRFPKDV